MDITKDIDFIRDTILKLADKFNATPTLYFNESDIQSELFSLLLPKYSEESIISNVFVWGTETPPPIIKILSRRLHSEFLLPEGRIDLAILDLDAVRFSVNSKGRGGYIQFLEKEGNHIFIELKCSRTIRSRITSKDAWLQLIKKDIQKSEHHQRYRFVVCFDFNALLNKSEIVKLQKITTKNIELMYFTSPYDNFLL